MEQYLAAYRAGNAVAVCDLLTASAKEKLGDCTTKIGEAMRITEELEIDDALGGATVGLVKLDGDQAAVEVHVEVEGAEKAVSVELQREGYEWRLSDSTLIGS
ncbi:MAG: hypothetical protein WD827_00050 [Solirubrobacterales bacterium]